MRTLAMMKLRETKAKPPNKIEAYVSNKQERARYNALIINLSEVWYDLGSYYQLSSLGNIRRNGKPLTPILRNGITYYLLDGYYYTQGELMELIND